MANKVILSEQFKIKAVDFINGLAPAVGIPVLYAIQELIPGWDIPDIAKIAISAFVGYILVQFGSKPKVTTTYSTNAKASEVSKDIIKQGNE